MSATNRGHQILADAIREHYNLGEVGQPYPVPDAHQRRHRKMLVDTGAGRFLIKTYPRDAVVLDALRFQHRLSDHLAENGLPVARIQRAKNRRRVIEIDDWAMELQEYVEGESMRVTAATLSVAAAALGKFHEVCRDLPRPARESRMWRFSEVPRATFAALFERARAEAAESVLNPLCNAIGLFLQEAGKALDWDARGQFETGLIHGDWHSANLLFRGDELVAILDLEFAGEGCFLEDLAYAVSSLCVRNGSEPKALEQRTHVLLKHYQTFRKLAYAEEIALYYAVGVKQIASVCCQI
ncbi:MAG: Phosphotransferase, partial [Candidatus Hydrogenedentes bacterium]|nr:Phosphotransferase [Candidatus Hydrogenedentota bacterium]